MILGKIARVIRGCIVTGMVLVAGGTVVAGVMSYWHGLPNDQLWIPMVTPEKRVQAALVGGTLHVVYSRPVAGPVAIAKTKSEFGPFYMKQATFGSVVAEGAGAPFWSIAVLAMVYPSIVYATGPLRRRRRRKRNQCIHCGYSLEGLTEPRCPECGREYGPKEAK